MFVGIPWMSRADCIPWLAKMTGGGVKIAIFGQSIFFLACFNCDLILIVSVRIHVQCTHKII
jgi:hypothetical protein